MVLAKWKRGQQQSPYNIMVIWEGTVVEENDLDSIVDFFKEEYATRVKCVGCVKLTNGRIDFAFLVHDEDAMNFALRRFEMASAGVPRWWEDIFFNGQDCLYPADFVECYPK